MAIRLSEPMQNMPKEVNREVQNLVLRAGGSGELARIVLATNEYARNVGDMNRALREELQRVREEVLMLRRENLELHRLTP